MKTKHKTNSMKNILLTMLLFTGIVEAQIVTIPDANFKAKLLAADVTNTIASTATNATIPDTFNKIDANNDGEIQQSEAAAVTLLDVSNSNIADLTGIEEFVNLRKLKCNGNQLTNLNIDLSNILVWLDCQDNNITSLNITDKIYLQLLFCNNNQLSNLTLSNLPSLANLYCDNNQLTSLNWNGLTALVLFGCSNNQLSNINFSGLNSIQSVNCLNNVPLTTIDLAGHTSLTTVFIGSNDILNPSINFNTVDLSGTSIINPTISNSIINTLNLNNCANLIGLNLLSNLIPNVILTGCNAIQLLDLRCSPNSLDVTNMLDLQYLDITGSNTIPSLDLSNNINLYSLKCDEYNPETLDLSNNINLVELICASNNLKYLFIKNGSNENQDNLEWTFNGSPNLLYACVDESQLSLVQSFPVFPMRVIGTYCSFTPGGNYNTITGNIKYDADSNGCDAADLPQSNIRVNINDGAITGASFSINTGNYTFYTQAGSFEITPAVENPTWFTFSPTTANIPFANNSNNTATQDFCISPNGFHPDVEIVISPVLFARPGFDATYQIAYSNKGNQTISGTVNLIFDNSRTDFVSANPLVDNLAVNSLSWNYSNLLPFETRTISVTLNVNSPTETPAVNIGDFLNFEATITPVIGDDIPEDNSFNYNQSVVGSYDPNDITCLEGDVVPSTEIGNYLHYTINFENTGTFPAENVVVKTEVDASKFDIGSLQLMNSNFPVDARITGNKVEFIFENIQLPIGGHGHILLKMKTQNSLVTGDAVANRGDIFFDYNFPIDTGLANTVFQTLSNSVFEMDNSVVVYPNPATSQVNVKSDSKLQSIQVYDVQGRILYTKLANEKQTTIDLTHKSKGIYFFKIITDKGSKIEKVIKE
jgi:hypothetical protein